jgi:hypothetical protein
MVMPAYRQIDDVVRLADLDEIKFLIKVADMPACCAYNLRNEMTPLIPTDEIVEIFLSTYLEGRT